MEDLCNAFEHLTQGQKEQAYTFLSEYLDNIKIVSVTETTAILNFLADLGIIIAP